MDIMTLLSVFEAEVVLISGAGVGLFFRMFKEIQRDVKTICESAVKKISRL